MPATYADFDCPTCGAQVYDNTENKRNPRAPDFKCSDRNCDWVQWPERGSRARTDQRRNNADRVQGGGRQAPRSVQQDDRSSRIERQHSQEMALRYFALSANGEVPETKQLRDMISWFQRDIGHAPSAPSQREPEPPPPDDSDDEVPF